MKKIMAMLVFLVLLIAIVPGVIADNETEEVECTEDTDCSEGEICDNGECEDGAEDVPESAAGLVRLEQ